MNADVLAQFAQCTQSLLAELTASQQAHRLGRRDPEDQRTIQLVEGQIQQIQVLTEEMLARLRGSRMALQRALHEMEAEERRLTIALVSPAQHLRIALASVYGRPEAP